MVSIKTSLLFLMLFTLGLTAPMPNKNNNHKPDLSDLDFNAKRLQSETKKLVPKYKSACKCQNLAPPILINNGNTISGRYVTIQQALGKVRQCLYPFIKVVRNITEEETNIKSKQELINIQVYLNDTYNSATHIMRTKKMPFNNKPNNTISMTKLNKECNDILKKTGKTDVTIKEVCNYFALAELQNLLDEISMAIINLNTINQKGK